MSIAAVTPATAPATRPLASVVPELGGVIVEAVRSHLVASGVIGTDRAFDRDGARDAAENLCGDLGRLGEQIAIFGAGLE